MNPLNGLSSRIASTLESTAAAIRTLLARGPLSAKHEKLKQQGQLGRLTEPAPIVQQRLQGKSRQKPGLPHVSILAGDAAVPSTSPRHSSGRARDALQEWAEHITAREYNTAEQFREDYPKWATAVRHCSMSYTDVRAPLGPRHGGVPDHLRPAWLRVEMVRTGLDPDLWEVLTRIVAREPCQSSGRVMSLADIGARCTEKPYDKAADNAHIGFGMLMAALLQARSILQPTSNIPQQNVI